MTNQEILQIALQQSAFDCNCNAEDFLAIENKIVLSKKNEKARVYMPLPLECDLVSYGNNIVAQVSPRMKETVGVIKEIDKLGRIVIPKEMRDRMGFNKEVEVVLTKEGILLKNSEYELVKRKGNRF